jgi:hypothetical protein
MTPPPVEKYQLKGPQVDPGSSYWMVCSQLHVLAIEELTQVTEDEHSRYFFPPPPDAAVTAKEFDELLDLARWRDDPCRLVSTSHCPKVGDGDRRPCHRPRELPGAFGCRRPISKLLNLVPPSLGAVLVRRFPGEQIVRTGRGMARAIEGETPGLHHRNALDYLIGSRSWSPPRQALVWAALDVALASALQAAWYFKWLNPRTSFRERPVEYARRVGKVRELDVLFDRPDELNPAYNLCPDGRPDAHGHFPDNDSGTPRHPAYPSGHSTYSGAASEILNFFFGTESADSLPAHPELGSAPGTTIGEELDNMADNIGMGRLWAGIHWRSDHEAGLKLGRAVACLVLHQLQRMVSDEKHGFQLCPPDLGKLFNQCDLKEKLPGCNETAPPPTREELEKEAEARRKTCHSPIRPDGPPGDLQKPCPPPPSPIRERLDANRGVQRGAQ